MDGERETGLRRDLPDDMTAEHLALRRVAELVARGTPQAELFAAVAVEASQLIGEDISLLRIEGDGLYSVIAARGGPAPVGTHFAVADDDEGLLAEMSRTRAPARRDDYLGRGGPAVGRDRFGVRSAVGVPVIVDDLIWGTVLATTTDGRRLPRDTESRLAQFAELVAAALANAQARADLQRLADEQAALRRVAELIARTTSTSEIFAAVAANASLLCDDAPMTLTRFGHGRDLVVLATQGGPAPIGTSVAYETGSLPDRVRSTARTDRVDDYRSEPDADLAAEFDLAAAVSVPISVGQDVWGMLTATSETGPLPVGTEQRLHQFASLVTAALASAHARTELEALAQEQAALRSVAELAAQDVPAEEVLAAVARQAARLTDVDFSTLLRFEPDGSTEIAALDGAPHGIVVGMRAPATGDGATQRVWRTGRPARIDNLSRASSRWAQVAHGHGFTTSAAVPILIRGSLWGVLVVVGRHKPLPAEIHTHLTSFAELAGTAIAAAHTRTELEQLAHEQAALRRVAELVARGVPPPDVFRSITTELTRLLGGHATVLMRYDGYDQAVVVASSSGPFTSGARVTSVPVSLLAEVPVTGRPVTIDTSTAPADATDDPEGIRVAVPITVDDQVWGLLATTAEPSPQVHAEDRLTSFAELAAASIANAETREKLTASRARVVATADETRRRLQRDVHDSAQQRLVHTVITLKLAKDAIAAGGSAAELVDEALENAQRANSELRDVVHGILPAALSRGGLLAGLESLIADFSLPVDLDADVPRLPTEVETTAYFIVAETLTNAVKHAQATATGVQLTVHDNALDLRVWDDGIGGADPSQGSGLTGLFDRVEAGNGTLRISSPSRGGTTVHATLPIPPEASDPMSSGPMP
jgi:signal transduction histidine kinase